MNLSSSYSDQQLLSSDDSEAAFRDLYERYWQPLYQRALGRLGSDDEAQDAVQEIFISLWRNRTKVVVPGSLEPYLFTALKYAIIKRVQRKPESKVSLGFAEGAAADLDPTELVLYKELQELIEAQVSKLPARMRTIYTLSRQDYLTTLQIAETLGLSEQTVKNTLSTALSRLRAHLSEHHFFSLFLF